MGRLPLCCAGCAVVVIGLVVWSHSPEAASGQVSQPAADSLVEGVFEGRTPCSPLANEFTGFPSAACEKIKWELTLYRDAGTGEARSYRYRGTRTSHNGTWSIIRGVPGNPATTVYELRYDRGSLMLLAADENVLLLMSADGKLMVGDASWSYTFNRTDRS
jgi:hypothetical protein